MNSLEQFPSGYTQEQREKFEAIHVGDIVSYKNREGDLYQGEKVIKKYPETLKLEVQPAQDTLPYTYGTVISVDAVIDSYTPTSLL